MHTLAIPIYHYFARPFDNPRENLLFLLFCQFIVSKDLYHTRCNASHEKSTRRKQRVKLHDRRKVERCFNFRRMPVRGWKQGRHGNSNDGGIGTSWKAGAFRANICCLEDRSKLISLFVNDYFVISLPVAAPRARFIRARLPASTCFSRKAQINIVSL